MSSPRTQHSLAFPPPPKVRGLDALRKRLATLLHLDADAGRLGTLLGVERPRLQRFLDHELEALCGVEGEAVVTDLRCLVDVYYPRGTLLDRRAHARAPSEGEDVGLHWHHEGEHYVGSPPGEPAGREGFIHPGLRRDLARVLENYLRREVVTPEVLTATEAERARLTRRVAALRAAWSALSDLLGTIEDKRAALWQKPKLVLASSWCLCLEQVPRELWDAIAACDAQRAEWATLFGVEVPADPTAAREVLEANPKLVVDTQHLGGDLADEVLEALGDLDAQRSGLLIQGDNADALALLRRRFKGAIQFAYMDPPFNTEGGGFAYADRFRRSSWLCFMEERLALTKELLASDGTLYAHIDHHEKERLRLLLDRHLHFVAEVIWRIGWLSGFKTRANKFIRNHDTIYHYGRCRRPLFNKTYLPYPEGYVRRDGKAPTGKGIPLEDTWNCSATDRLDSIQIMSFSREKAGKGNLTQKNENLLARMLTASSRPGDWILDPFLGSGSACAAAHKMGRRWIGVEHSGLLDEVALPRLKRLLFGDPYGISKATGWTGGGAFEVLRLETYGDVLANLKRPGRDAAGHVSAHFDGSDLVLRTGPLAEPRACRVRTAGGWSAVDATASLSVLLGLSSRRRVRIEGGVVETGIDADGGRVLVHWGGLGTGRAETASGSPPPLAERLATLLAERGWERSAGLALSCDPAALAPLLPGWAVEALGPTFLRLQGKGER